MQHTIKSNISYSGIDVEAINLVHFMLFKERVRCGMSHALKY